MEIPRTKFSDKVFGISHSQILTRGSEENALFVVVVTEISFAF